MFAMKKYHESLTGEIVLSILALISVGLLVLELSANLAPNEVLLLNRIDIAIALVFIIDFVVGLRLSDDKKAYWKHNWYILLASVPIPDGVFQSLRILRILRLVRLIRMVARVNKKTLLADIVSQNGARYLYTISIIFVVIIAGAASIFSAEAGTNPQINNFFDAIWWTCVTITTVGYGDIYPVTWAGRLVAIFLMFFGVGLVGAIAGIVGSSIIKSPEQN